MNRHFVVFPLAAFVLLLLAACEPLAAPLATPQVIIVTAVPSSTPPPTLTPTFTPTPSPSPTVTPSPSPTPRGCLGDPGEVIEINDNPSPSVGENLRYRVYLPPCYGEALKRFPVAYLLHGAGFREDQFQNIGTIDALERAMRLGTLGPMILVMPYTGSIGNTNTFPPSNSYETVLLDELLPEIERDFCTISNREHRALGGISRGGFWALSVAFRHPDRFSAVGGHSAALDETNAPPNNNPLDLAQNAPLVDELRIFLDNGVDDFAGLGLTRLSGRLTEREVPHTYTIYPTGDHNEAYWSSHIGEYLAFYGEAWPRDLNALPSCLEPSP